MGESQRSIEVIARGVWIRDGAVLFCRSVAKGYFYLPGGHVEHGEPAASALAREMVEETGLAVQVGPLLLVSEHVFRQDGKERHEINLAFAMSAAFHVEQITSREPDIAFDWIDLAAVVTMDVRPVAIAAWLVSGGAIERSAGWLSDVPG